MIYRKKAIPVLILKLPSGKFKITDMFGKVEELTEQDFNRYIEFVVTLTTSPAPITKKNLQDIKDILESGDVESALNTIDSLL